MPAVLSTPKLIGLIERTARESLYPFLDENERTVGAEVEVRHLAPTPLGQEVTISTRVIGGEGKLWDFQFEVRDQHEVMGNAIVLNRASSHDQMRPPRRLTAAAKLSAAPSKYRDGA